MELGCRNNSNKEDPNSYQEKWKYSDSVTDSFRQMDQRELEHTE